jgi:hypothetical protein
MENKSLGFHLARAVVIVTVTALCILFVLTAETDPPNLKYVAAVVIWFGSILTLVPRPIII